MFRFARGRFEFRVKKIPRPFKESVYAFTFCPFVFYEPQVWDDVCVQKHEAVHWKHQLWTLVIPWIIVYLLLSIWYGGGRRNPMEKSGYAAQDKCNESQSNPT